MKVNLNAVKIFFDPHPGLAGAIIPIPGAVKRAADKLNNTKTSLRDAISKIKAVTGGNVKIYKDCIILEIKCDTPFGLATNYFRVIRFKSVLTQLRDHVKS